MKKHVLSALMAFFVVGKVEYSLAGEWIYDVSGIADGFYGYSQYSDKYRRNYKHHHTPVSAEIYTFAGYRFDVDTEFKIGLDGQIADGKEVEDYNHGTWGENLYATLTSNYGEFSLGQIYNAAYQLAVGAPTVGYFRINNSPLTDFIANPNWQRHSKTTSYRTLNSTYLNTDADAPKVSYVTPEFYSTKIAVSYTPDSYSEAGLINKHSHYDNRSSYATGLYHNFVTDVVEAETSLGYAYNRKNNQEASAGLSLYRKGWTLGGSYRQSWTTGSDYALNIHTHNDQPLFYDGYRQGRAFNVGLSYEIGPLKTGVSYFAAYAGKTDNKDKIISWANRFAFNKYLALYLTAAYAEYKGEGVEMKSNRGFATIGGLELSF